MNEIWANRLIAGNKHWSNVPATRKNAVKKVLKTRIEEGEITAEQYQEITGEAL